jgi:subtilisin family serine protease
LDFIFSTWYSWIYFRIPNSIRKEMMITHLFIYLLGFPYLVSASIEKLSPYLVIARTTSIQTFETPLLHGRRLSDIALNAKDALIDATNKHALSFGSNTRRLQDDDNVIEDFSPFSSDISSSFSVVHGFSAMLSLDAVTFLGAYATEQLNQQSLVGYNVSIVLYHDVLVYAGPYEQDAVVQSAQEGAALNQEVSWGLDRIDQATLPLDQKYFRAGSGAGVDVYVADSGIRLSHNEFFNQGNLQARSANFVNNDAMPRPMGEGEDASDCAGHGTHLSSTIAGASFGVAPGARLIPVRIYGCTASGPVSAVLRGFDFILASMRSRPSVPAVINLSFAAKRLDVLDEAVRSLANAGGVVVAAAGNSFKDACSTSPAAERSCIAVGSTNKNDEWSSFSDYGKCIFLSAPGSEILGASHEGNALSLYMSGTSMATPHVTGVVAIILQTQLDSGKGRLTVSQTRQVLHCLSSDIAWLNPTVVSSDTATTFLYSPPGGIPTECLPENLPLWSTPASPSSTLSPSVSPLSQSSTSSVTFKDGFFSISSGAKRSSPSSFVGLAVAAGLTLLLLRRI